MSSTASNYEPDLLNEVYAARILSVSERTLQAWRLQRRGPTFVRVGRAIRYRRADLLGWIQDRLVTNT